MRILVTNDDGIDSTGLHVLARRMQKEADVVVVAPDTEYSGSGASLGTLDMMQPDIRRVAVDGVGEAWTVAGPPGLCVLFARTGVFGDFDLVVSGINPGANVGRSIYHSGTVGACLTARNGSRSAIAVSQDTPFDVLGQGQVQEEQHWESAAEVAAVATRGLIDAPPASPIVVNVNVPNLAIGDMAGWRHVEVGSRSAFSIETATLVERPGHEGTYRLQIEWAEREELPIDTDGGAINHDLVAVSYLSVIAHEPRDDVAELENQIGALFA